MTKLGDGKIGEGIIGVGGVPIDQVARPAPRRDKSLSVPRLKYPFEIGADGALQVEQGSEEDVASAVEVLMRSRYGDRQDLPTYGTPDYTFTMNLGQVDLDQLREIISKWEPRAEIEFVLTGEGTKEQTVEIQVRTL